MDMKCQKCLEPWESDSIFEFSKVDDGGSKDDFIHGIGCPSCDWGKNKEHAIHGDSLYSQCASAAADIMGDDIDGIISSMDDGDSIGYFDEPGPDPGFIPEPDPDPQAPPQDTPDTPDPIIEPDSNGDTPMIKLNREDSKKLQFLLAGASKDSARPILEGVNFNGAAVTADGFRLHALNTEDLINQDLASLKGTFNLGKVRAGENIIDPEPVEGNYPEYEQILPKQDHGALIVIQPKFLVEFCKYLDKGKPVYIMLRGSDKPIELKGTLEDSDVYGLIMPMYSNESPDNYAQKWEPKKDQEDQAEPVSA